MSHIIAPHGRAGILGLEDDVPEIIMVNGEPFIRNDGIAPLRRHRTADLAQGQLIPHRYHRSLIMGLPGNDTFNAGLDAAISYFRQRRTALTDLSAIEHTMLAMVLDHYIADLVNLRHVPDAERRAAQEAATRRAT